jgi:hypothetical protein
VTNCEGRLVAKDLERQGFVADDGNSITSSASGWRRSQRSWSPRTAGLPNHGSIVPGEISSVMIESLKVVKGHRL